MGHSFDQNEPIGSLSSAPMRGIDNLIGTRLSGCGARYQEKETPAGHHHRITFDPGRADLPLPCPGEYGVSKLVVLSGQTFQEGPFVFTALLIAIANFAIGIGCLFGWRPVWFYLVIISVINFIIALFVLYNTDQTQLRNMAVSTFWLVVATYVLLTVHSRKTRKWFHL